MSDLLRFVAVEALAYAFHGVLMPLGAARAAEPTRDGDEGPAVLFLHGHGGGPAGFVLLQRAMEKTGYRRFSAFDYRSTGSVRAIAERLDRFMARHHPDEPVIIVGHSLGGIVARYWIQELGGKAQALATLSTPHQGLPAAAGVRLLPVLGELTPGSPLLQRLEAGSGRLEGVRCLSLVSERDHFVRPWRRARFHPAELVRVRDAGHVGVLFDPDVHDLLLERLLEWAPPRRRASSGALVPEYA